MNCKCDRCGNIFSNGVEEKYLAIQHFSVVGDLTSASTAGKRIEANVCQACLMALIKDFCRVSDSGEFGEQQTPIVRLGVSRYTLDRLLESGISTIEQLCQMEEIEVKKAAGGSSAFREVVDAMQAKSFKLAA